MSWPDRHNLCAGFHRSHFCSIIFDVHEMKTLLIHGIILNAASMTLKLRRVQSWSTLLPNKIELRRIP